MSSGAAFLFGALGVVGLSIQLHFSSYVTGTSSVYPLILSNGLVLIYNDVRRFGFFKFYNTTKLNKIIFLRKLGLIYLLELLEQFMVTILLQCQMKEMVGIDVQ